MPEKTKQHYAFEHAFICKDKPIYGLDENTKALILGTIYPCKCGDHEPKQPYKPHKHKNFMCDFFYGNDYSIWGILKIAFPKLEICSLKEVKEAFQRKDEKMKTESADKIKAMLKKCDIAISDTILKTKREYGFDCSKDKFDKEHTEYNLGLIEAIKKSKIEKIYFTSMYTFRIFKTHICEPNNISTLPKNIELCKINSIELFDRKINLICLPSPSRQANRGLGKNKERKKHPKLTVSEWRIKFYQKSFKKYLG